MQRGGNREGGYGARQLIVPVDVLQDTRLQHCFGHFLHKQRHPIGPLDDVPEHLRRQMLFTRDVFRHPYHRMRR